MPAMLRDEFWQRPLALIEAEVGVSVADGLCEAEARRRRRSAGPNLIRPRVERALFVQFIGYFRNPLVLVLLAASTVAGMLGDIESFFIITSIVLMSVTLDFLQEYRAHRAVERLRHAVALRAQVVRDGRSREILVSALVPGDVVQLAAGDRVPADGRLLEARDLFVNQALLTGESYPVEKQPTDALPAADMAAATNSLFMGTTVISGSGRMLVVRTGAATALVRPLAAAPHGDILRRGARHGNTT